MWASGRARLQEPGSCPGGLQGCGVGAHKIVTPRPAGCPAPAGRWSPAASHPVDMERQERVNRIPKSAQSILNPSCHHMGALCPKDGNVKSTNTNTGRRNGEQVCCSVLLTTQTERTLLLPGKSPPPSLSTSWPFDVSFCGRTSREKQGFPRLVGGWPGGGQGRDTRLPSGAHSDVLIVSLSLSVLTKRRFFS